MKPKMTLNTLTAIVTVVLLLSASTLFAQSPVSRVTVQVRPEMQLTSAASNVQLAVRLAPSAQAQVWRADACAAAPADAFLVAQSGKIQIPVTTLGTGSMVCAASTDGSLTQSLNVAQLGAQSGGGN